jgi:uncharacterized protein (TIGR00290 family)
MPSLCSFSGGKDSCLALWRAQRSGLDVRSLLVMFEESGERSRSHGLPLDLIRKQAEAMQLQLRVGNASWATYEAEFVNLLKQYRADGFETAIFGDIDLQPHREWEERVCTLADIKPVLPLWLEKRDALSREVIAEGFKAVVVCVDTRFLDASFCGREYDAQFIVDLPSHVDACGENGEFHTFVYDGPNFSKPVSFEIAQFEDYVAPSEFSGVRYRFATLR